MLEIAPAKRPPKGRTTERSGFLSNDYATRCKFAHIFGKMSNILLFLSIFFLSSVKYLVGSGLAVASLPAWEGFLISFAGGAFGIFTFVYGGSAIKVWMKRKFPPKKEVKRFSRKNRFLVNLRNKGGLVAIALLSPLIISIPVGCFLSIGIESNRLKVLIFQLVALLIWSIVIFGSKHYGLS